MKICPAGVRVAPCGQRDMKKFIVAFRNFAYAPIKTTTLLLLLDSVFPKTDKCEILLLESLY